LNLLKDFNVDVIKLDMKFLSSMNVKSKAIVKSLITMAKDIGIKTLAEGVETEEEKDFLHEIGCGRLQGFFYGKPLPLEEAFANVSGKGIKTEARKWTAFYDSAEYHVRSTDAPLELIVYDGTDFRTLFMNDAYKLQIFDELPNNIEADGKIYMPGSPLLNQYRTFAELLAKTNARVIVACPTGMGTSRLLSGQLKNYYDDALTIVDQAATLTLSPAYFESHEADFVISTVPIPNLPLPVVVVGTLLTEEDRRRIDEAVRRSVEALAEKKVAGGRNRVDFVSALRITSLYQKAI
jgi:galactitol-specific phosphotransferase system IIB component